MLLNILKIIVFFVCTQSFSKDSIKVGAQKPISDEVEDSIEIPASLIANESVLITSVVSEKIKKIHFEEGSFVKKGKLLIELKDDEEQAKLLQVVAELEEAELNYNRALKLSEKGNISQSVLDNRLTEKIRLTGKVDEIKAKINDLVLKAPFDGTIGLRNYSVGAFVKPGDIITTIYDFKTLKVEASVPEAYIGRIKIKDTVKIKVNSSEIVYSGEVYVIDPYVDEKTRTFRIISKIESKKELKPGMMAKKILNFDSKESFLVPESAIIPIDNQTFIYVISDENFIKKVEVFTGKRLDGKVEIKKGLKSSDKIVFEGINKLKAGIKVKIK